MTSDDTKTAVPVPSPIEVADSLPAEAVQFDLANPPVSGSVQRDPDGPLD